MRWPYLVAVAAYCAGIFWLSSQPLTGIEPYKFPGYDKIGHGIIYGGLATVVALGMWRSGRPYSYKALFWAPVCFAALYGITDEIHQAFRPAREFDPWDIVANAGGAFLAMVFWRALLRRFGPRFRTTTTPSATESR